LKIKGLRWLILSLVTLVITINILDRGTLNYMWLDGTDSHTGQVVRRGIASELGLIDGSLNAEEQQNRSKEILAWINIAFMAAYGISNFVSGRIYDKIGTRKGFSISALVWGGAIALTSFASGIKSLAFFRIMLGLGEAGPFPGGTKVNAEWFPLKERAIAQGFYGAASSLGNILVPVIIPFLFLGLGWRVTFLILGGICALWVIPWYIITKTSPKKHLWITPEEREYILEGMPIAEKEEKHTLSIKQLLCDKRSYSVILSRLFLDPVWWMFMTWLPIYLHEVYHLDLRAIASVAWIPFAGAALGGLGGGWIAGKLIQMNYSPILARKITISIGGLIMIPGMIGAAFAPSAMAATFMLVLILGGFLISITNIQTLPTDFHSGKTVGSLAGLGGLSAVVGVIISTRLVPVLTRSGNWVPFFSMGLLLVLASMFSVFLTLKSNNGKTES
jgi:ACS family hexuronate transporter-like MFS transporter